MKTEAGETLFNTSFEHGLSEALYVLTTAHRSLTLIKYLSLDIDHWYPHALAHAGKKYFIILPHSIPIGTAILVRIPSRHY